jgi:hypothetical protein
VRGRPDDLRKSNIGKSTIKTSPAIELLLRGMTVAPLNLSGSSKYPPAKPGALRVEPLKAAIGVAGAPPICGPPEGGSWVPRLVCCVLQLRIRFVSYTGEVPRSIVRIRLCGLGLPMRSRSSVDGALLVHLATRARRFVDGRLWRDCRKCQTFAASPAEPGDLLC